MPEKINPVAANRPVEDMSYEERIKALGEALTDLCRESHNEVAFLVGATLLKAVPDLVEQLIQKHATVVDKKRLKARGFGFVLEEARGGKIKFKPESILKPRRKSRRNEVEAQAA